MQHFGGCVCSIRTLVHTKVHSSTFNFKEVIKETTVQQAIGENGGDHPTMQILPENVKKIESGCMEENWGCMKNSETTQVITIKLATLLQERILNRIKS